MISDFINDEQLLQICLENQSNRDFDMDGLSGELITLYAMSELGVGSTLIEVAVRVSQLCSDYTIEGLVKDGFLDVDITENGPSYSIKGIN